MSVKVIGKSEPVTRAGGLPLQMPLYLEGVSAGFPSPAQDYVDQALDLNELCIRHPAATFFVRVDGDSMEEAGIFAGDILIVDRALTAEHNDIVIASVMGELTVKQLELRPAVRLVPRNVRYAPIEITEGTDLDIFGVVTNVVRSMRRKS